MLGVSTSAQTHTYKQTNVYIYKYFVEVLGEMVIIFGNSLSNLNSNPWQSSFGVHVVLMLIVLIYL